MPCSDEWIEEFFAFEQDSPLETLRSLLKRLPGKNRQILKLFSELCAACLINGHLTKVTTQKLAEKYLVCIYACSSPRCQSLWRLFVFGVL